MVHQSWVETLILLQGDKMNELKFQLFKYLINNDDEFREKIKSNLGLEIVRLTSVVKGLNQSLSGVNNLIDSSPTKRPKLKPLTPHAADRQRKAALTKTGNKKTHKEAILNFIQSTGREGATFNGIKEGLKNENHAIKDGSLGYCLYDLRGRNNLRSTKEPGPGKRMRYYWQNN